MEDKLKSMGEARQDFIEVIEKFNHLRNENSSLDELLKNVESVLEGQCTGIDLPLDPSPSSSSTFPGNFSRGKKRKLIYTEEDSVDTDDTDTGLGSSLNQSLTSKTELEAPVPEEKSPEENAFGIDLLLEMILGGLSASDLKHCRVVNSSWNAIASKILLRQEATKIELTQIQFGKASKRFSRAATKHSKNSKEVDLNSLSNLISKSFYSGSTFPCNFFAFKNGNLNASDLQNFLSKHGSTIKHLILHIQGDSDSDPFEFLSLLRKLLLQDIPNVEHLELAQFPSLWDEELDLSELFPEPSITLTLLSKLKSINFSSGHCPVAKKIFQDIINIAKNIQSIALTTCKGPVIKSLIESNKVDLLTSLEVVLDRQNLDTFSSFAEQNLKLKKLVTSIEWTNSGANFHFLVTDVVAKFLKSCSESLEEFYLQPLGDFRLAFPVLPKLKLIRMLNDEDIQVKLFPTGLKMSEVFPALESFESVVYYSPADYDMFMEWNASFGANSTDSVPTMQNINISCGPPLQWIQNFSRMFENLTSVRVGLVDNFPGASRVFWQMNKLEKLEFIIVLNEVNMKLAIDTGFTGFSDKTCSDLRRDSRDVGISKLGELREKPSILDVKCLRKLHVMFYDPLEETRTAVTVPFVSHVTGVFAFQMCHELRVTVSARAHNESNKRSVTNGLSPLLPYVESVTKARNPFDNNCLTWDDASF